MGVREKIESAYQMLLKQDAHLLVADANERSITHHLAIYLQQEFPEYNVDCEYNRNGREPKRLPEFKKTIESDDTQAITVYPDIIVHHRGSSDNFIVIEAKKTTNNEDSDMQKLAAYKTDLNYIHAYFIKLPVGNEYQTIDQDKLDSYIMEIK